MLLKVTAKLLPWGLCLYLTTPVGFAFLLFLLYSHMCWSPALSTDRCVNQSAYCSNYVFIYSQRKFRNVCVACLYLYPLCSVCSSYAVRVSLCPPVSGMFKYELGALFFVTTRGTPVKYKGLHFSHCRWLKSLGQVVTELLWGGFQCKAHKVQEYSWCCWNPADNQAVGLILHQPAWPLSTCRICLTKCCLC